MFLRRARWVTDKYILLMLGVFPLFWGFWGYDAITESKFWFFAVATGLWLAATVTLLLWGAFRGERYSVEVRPAHLCMGLWLMMGAVSSLGSEYGGMCFLGSARFNGYLTMVLYGVIFFGVSWLGRLRRCHLWALAVSAAVSCVIAVLQLQGLNPLGLFPPGTNYFDKYVLWAAAFLGTMGNAGLFSAHLCLAVPASAGLALRSEKRTDRWLLVPAVLGAVLLWLCDVDAGVLAAGVCLLVSVPVLLKGKRAALRAAVCSGGIVLLGLAALYFWPGESGTLWEMSRVLHGELLDSFGSHRGEIWKQCWELVKERLWLGGGPGTSPERMHIVWEGEHYITSVDNPHNAYLGYLVDIGLVGTLGYIGGAVCALISWIRRRQDPLFAALGCGFLCYLVQDVFGLNLSITAPMLFVVWGLLESRTAPDEGPGNGR